MADRLNVTSLDFDTIKTNLKNFLKQQSEFQDYDFEGSGLNVLLDILAYNTHYNSYYLNMVANESFLDSAMLRNSVVSHAKKMGYTPRSSAAPRATVNVIVDSGSSTPGSLTMPKGFQFLSNQIDNQAYNFVTLSDVTVQKTANNFVFSNLNIYEGEFVTYNYTHTQSSNPKQIFDIPEQNIDTNTLTISVRPSISNTEVSVYSKAQDVLTVGASSEVYYLQEGLNGTYQFYFGDNILGKKLPDGAYITATYLTTNSTAANRANNFVATSSLNGFTNITINSISSASGGADRETVDQIKYAAPLNFLSQNRAVTKNDYIKLIQQKYPAFEAVNVWGGEENDPPIYGKVFVAAKPRLGFEVTETEKEFVKDSILKPISIMTVTPEIVDVDYNYLKIEAAVYYDPTKTTQTESDIQTGVKSLVQTFCDTELNKFNTLFRYSNLEGLIDNYNKSIVSNEIELFVGKRFIPDLINSGNYTLDYGFELERGTTYDNFYSSPTFSMLDEEGATRTCFFEEIPSSFSGIESITVTNPGYNYISTPTVTIVGDGEGATATATIVNGKLSKVTVTNPGVGYTSAAIQIIGGGGLLAAASAVLEGRFGQLRIAYYKLDEVSSQNTKVVINRNRNNGVAGTIDYVLGKITLQDFKPTDVNNNFKDIMIHFRPKINIIESKLNKMLVLDESDPTSIAVKTIKTS
jgi:hypothetical protein